MNYLLKLIITICALFCTSANASGWEAEPTSFLSIKLNAPLTSVKCELSTYMTTPYLCHLYKDTKILSMMGPELGFKYHLFVYLYESKVSMIKLILEPGENHTNFLSVLKTKYGTPTEQTATSLYWAGQNVEISTFASSGQRGVLIGHKVQMQKAMDAFNQAGASKL